MIVKGPPEGLMRQIVCDLEHAAEDRPDWESFRNGAMVALVGLRDRIAEEGRRPRKCWRSSGMTPRWR
jgi:hypothetical protein